MTHSPAQLGFEALLQDADSDNRAHRFKRETGHLPATMEKGLPFFRALIERHHSATLAAEVEEVMRLREEARKLALKLNGGDTGILAGPNAAGCVLERETAAPDGAVPLWGQQGYFIIEAAGMRVRIALEGVFGIGSGTCFWPGFGAYAVDATKPFLSHTGYRSFQGLHGDPVPGFTPETFIAAVIATYVERVLKGRLVSIGKEYRRPR